MRDTSLVPLVIPRIPPGTIIKLFDFVNGPGGSAALTKIPTRLSNLTSVGSIVLTYNLITMIKSGDLALNSPRLTSIELNYSESNSLTTIEDNALPDGKE